MKVNRTLTVTVELPEDEALKLARALTRALTVIDKLEPGTRERLVNTHTVDTLLALKTGLYLAIPGESAS